MTIKFNDFINNVSEDFWFEVEEKFPNYSNPGSYDHPDATEFILNKMKAQYEYIEWESIEDEIRQRIREALK